MLQKASIRIKKAKKWGQKVNTEVDENGNSFWFWMMGEDDIDIVCRNSL